MKHFGRSNDSAKEIGTRFVFTLLPISIAYEVAHYASLLLLDGQRIISLISDPLGIGWNVFGTSPYLINRSIVNFGIFWNVQVILIVLGHVLAVYLTHIAALRSFADLKSALRSQYPIMVLMILYTVSSLWILSLPLSIIPE